MGEFLFQYKRPEPTTWVYMSSFLTIGLYFVFHRFWSIRNLDVVLVILLAPGLLMVHEGRRRELKEIESLVAQSVFEKRASDNAEPTEASTGSEVATANPPIESKPSALIVVKDLDDAKQVIDVVPAIEPTYEFTPQGIQFSGFIWLFAVQCCLLIRLMLDPLMVRRPLLDPNLTAGGLNFIGVSLFVFMMANVVTSTPRQQIEQGPKLGPGYQLMHMLPAIPTRPAGESLVGVEPTGEIEQDAKKLWLTTVAKTVAILAHLAIVIGIVLIGNRHFGNIRSGIGCALLYLLLPYTAQMTGRVDHAVPAALLLWAVLMYRNPLISGILLGLAAGLVYYPLFLLPLWFSFYWQRGARRFGVGVISTLLVLMLLLSFVDSGSMLDYVRRMYGLISPLMEPRGIWSLGWNPMWRFPVIAGFVILSFFFAVWPAQKNLGTLISATAAIMVASQFWHGDGGGQYIAWFLPFLLLTIFRPNLQDRVALKVIDGGAVMVRQRSRLEAEAV